MNALRYIGSVLIAFLVGSVVIGAIQLLGMLVFPLSDSLTMSQFEKMSWEEKHDLLHGASPVVYIPVLLAYLVGMVMAGAVGTRLFPGRSLLGALIIGVLFTLVNVLNVRTMPQPLWVSVASFIIFIPAALARGWFASRKRAPAA